MVINPAYPLRSALVQLLDRPKRHWVSVGDVTSAAGVSSSRANAYLSILDKQGVVMVDRKSERVFKAIRWALYAEETGRSCGRGAYTKLTSEQRLALAGVRDTLAHNLASECRRMRRLTGYSVPQLAEAAGTTQSMANKVLEGKQLAPMFELLKVTTALRVPLEEWIPTLRLKICRALGEDVD